MAAAMAAPRQAVTILAEMTPTNMLSGASVSMPASILSSRGEQNPQGRGRQDTEPPRTGSGLPPPRAEREPSIGVASGPAAQGLRLLCLPLVQVLPWGILEQLKRKHGEQWPRGASVLAAGAETGTNLPPRGHGGRGDS